jgi:hypothetical protein
VSCVSFQPPQWAIESYESMPTLNRDTNPSQSRVLMSASEKSQTIMGIFSPVNKSKYICLILEVVDMKCNDLRKTSLLNKMVNLILL